MNPTTQEILKGKEGIMNKNRPSWIDYYLGLAFFIAARSHDEETQHGCVICDEKHRPVGMGYNGFPAGIHEDGLPTTRPDKYPWMIHSEANAVNNIRVKIDGTTAFVTGQCCNPCIMNMYNNGVREVYMADCHGSHVLKKEDQDFFDDFIARAAKGGDPMTVYKVKPNLNWILPVVEKLKGFGFITEDIIWDQSDKPVKLICGVVNQPYSMEYIPVYMEKGKEAFMMELIRKARLAGYTVVRFDALGIGNTFEFLNDSGKYHKLTDKMCTPMTSGRNSEIRPDTLIKITKEDLSMTLYD